jgi:hypothetical protein
MTSSSALRNFLDSALQDKELQRQVQATESVQALIAIAASAGFEVDLHQGTLKNWARYKMPTEDWLFNPALEETAEDLDIRLLRELKLFLSEDQLRQFLEALQSNTGIQGQVESASDIEEVFSLANSLGFVITFRHEHQKYRYLKAWLRSQTEEADGLFWGEVSEDDELEPWLSNLRELSGV